MKKMTKLFGKHPPKRKLTSLDAVIDDWTYRFGPNGISKEMRDEVVEFCAKAMNYEQAVHRACESKRPNGHVHNHQSRVPIKVRRKFERIIMKSKLKPSSFDKLYDALDAIKPEGIGPVTLYDVATRIAAFMQLEVRSLYLHAGVRIGWCLLHGSRSPAQLRIERSDLPGPLLRLPTDEIEDMLCAYREFLKPWLKSSPNA